MYLSRPKFVELAFQKGFCMSLTTLLVPTYKQNLHMVAGLLDKAVEQKPEIAEALLSARLSPGMLPLSAHVRVAINLALNAVARLSEAASPAWLEEVIAEARSAESAPGSVSAAKRRIEQALAYLDELADDALDAAADNEVTVSVPGGLMFDMNGKQFARDWALPQFYFHVTTAYAILRNQGVEIGKADFVPHMLSYLRPGTMPAA